MSRTKYQAMESREDERKYWRGLRWVVYEEIDPMIGASIIARMFDKNLFDVLYHYRCAKGDCEL